MQDSRRETNKQTKKNILEEGTFENTTASN